MSDSDSDSSEIETYAKDLNCLNCLNCFGEIGKDCFRCSEQLDHFTQVRRSASPSVIDDDELVRLTMKMNDEILYQPPSLLEICKKNIMKNFEIDDVIKMKEIVPDMKF